MSYRLTYLLPWRVHSNTVIHWDEKVLEFDSVSHTSAKKYATNLLMTGPVVVEYTTIHRPTIISLEDVERIMGPGKRAGMGMRSRGVVRASR